MKKVHRKIIRQLRVSIKHWSPKKDRNYHDSLFSEQIHDPFSPSYPGNITIRRFADLTVPYIEDLKCVLDLGCGAGEITCELARRHPDISFFGVDHSENGILRAQKNAGSLDLKNITFSVADIENFNPESDIDIVLMFDSFHHLTDPRQFIHRFGKYVTRFLLIEPRGNWKGSWQKDIDFDWLLLELEKIRSRIAYLTREEEPPVKGSSTEPSSHQDSPIEHRYTLDDFKTFFPGYGLDIHGTVSGLDVFPPDSGRISLSRERFGHLAYDLYKDIDTQLNSRKLDLLAKHWVIYAEYGTGEKELAIPAMFPEQSWRTPVKGPYDVEYLLYTGPHTARSGEVIKAEVRFRNKSFQIWSSADKQTPDYLSYHWLNKKGQTLVQDGERGLLPGPVGPDEEGSVSFRIKMPDKSGRYVLAIDLVRENTTWFSDAGSPCLRIPFRIRSR